jgi:hypothetical protein
VSAADFDEGYRQGRRDTRAELVPVIDRQRAEIHRLQDQIVALTERTHQFIDALESIAGLS